MRAEESGVVNIQLPAQIHRQVLLDRGCNVVILISAAAWIGIHSVPAEQIVFIDRNARMAPAGFQKSHTEGQKRINTVGFLRVDKEPAGIHHLGLIALKMVIIISHFVITAAIQETVQLIARNS